MQIPWMQVPWLEQVGSIHCPSSTLHSAPFHPSRHTHLPFSYRPFPLHNTGHESVTGNNLDYSYKISGTTTQTLPQMVVQCIRWETVLTCSEWGYAFLSLLGRKFSKSLNSLSLPVFLSHTQTHTHTQTLKLIPHAVSIYSSTTWAWLPRQPRNCRKSSWRPFPSFWKGRENNRENGGLGRRALGIYRTKVKSRAFSMQRRGAAWLM